MVPLGEPLALRIEAAADAATRQRLMGTAATLVGQVRGRSQADAWLQRLQGG